MLSPCDIAPSPGESGQKKTLKEGALAGLTEFVQRFQQIGVHTGGDLEAMVKQGADVNVKNQEGWTPLVCFVSTMRCVCICFVDFICFGSLPALRKATSTSSRRWWRRPRSPPRPRS